MPKLGGRPILVTGDVGDRGPHTRAVVDRLIERGARGVRGNHEEWLRSWLVGPGFDPFALHRAMGGEATLASYGVTSRKPGGIEAERWRVPPEHVRWITSLPIALDLGVIGKRYWLVHAGVPSSAVSVEDAVRFNPDSLLWSKNEPWDAPPLNQTVIMGHLIVGDPVDTGRVIAIDTGAGTIVGGRLTAVLLPERVFVTVG